MKTDNFDSLISELQNNRPNDFILKHALKDLTRQDLDNLDRFISERKWLIDYNTLTPLTNHAKCRLLSEVMPILYEDEKIEQYFLDILIKMHSDESTWTTYHKRDLFRMISGFTYYRVGKGTFYLSERFERIYASVFLKKYFYPAPFVQRGLDLIKNRQPLSSHYEEFHQKYQRHPDDSYIVFMQTYFVDVIGNEEFYLYLQSIANQYDESLDIRDNNTYTMDRFLNYMFGYNWTISMHLYCARSRNQEAPEVEKLILRAIIPYTIVNYPSKRQRNHVYAVLNMNEDEIEELESKINGANRQHYVPKAVAAPVDLNEVMRFGSTYGDVFNLIDRAIIEMTSTSRYTFSKTQVYKKCLELSSDDLFSDISYANRTPSIWAQIVTYIEKKTEEAYDQFYLSNAHEFEKDEWIIYYKMRDHYRSTTLSFDIIAATNVKDELMEYCKQHILNCNYNYSAIQKLRALVTAIRYLVDNFQVSSLSQVTEYQILSYLRYLEADAKLKPGTLSERLYSIKMLFRYYSDKYGTPDPALGLALKNISEHHQSTSVIPDDLLVYVDNHISDMKQRDCALAYRLLLETGWRFGDIQQVLPEHITLSDDGSYGIVTTLSPKTRKTRTKRLLGADITDVISVELFNDLMDYVKDTEKEREVYGVTTLFYSIVNGRVSKFRPENLNRAINNMLRNAGIKSINESYVRFSTKQTRKTVASTLISAGAPITSVQKKLGHVSPQTAERYYAEVQKKKLAELNDEFYKKKFNVYMDAEKLKLFTEDERKILYVDFCMNRRTVELGVCSKHPSEGRCSALGHTSCASCPKLCTGKKWLDRWERLAKDSENLLQMFREKYADLGIPESEYKNYIEYRQEETAYLKYLAVIEQIKKEDDHDGQQQYS